MASAPWGWKSDSETPRVPGGATGWELPWGRLGRLPTGEVTRSGEEAAFQIGLSWELQDIAHLEDQVTTDHVIEAF